LKTKKILIWISIFLTLLCLLFFIGYLKEKSDLAYMDEGPGKISSLVYVYRDKYKQWPKNTEEIQKFINNDEKLKGYDLNSYQDLIFIENTNKVLTIRYKSYKKGNLSTGPGQLDLSIQAIKQ
jgi:hypothetical protein